MSHSVRGVTFEDYDALVERCRAVRNLDNEIHEIKEEWDKLSARLFEMFPKKEIIRALQSMWTQLNDETGSNSREEQWTSFVSLLDCYSDRMNINRWCRLQLLLGNAVSH